MGAVDSADRLEAMAHYREERGEPKTTPKNAVGYGEVQYGPFTHRYFVVRKNKQYQIAFEGNNSLVAIAEAHNVHQRAHDVLTSFLDFVYHKGV